MNNRAAYLVSKKLTGEISESEIQELNLQLMQDPKLYEVIHCLEIAWEAQCLNFDEEESNELERLMKKLHFADPEYFQFSPDSKYSHTDVKKRVFSINRILQAAAVLIFFMLGAWWFLGNNIKERTSETKQSLPNQVVTKPGNRTHIVLRDGTKVWLNGDSKITYANLFDGETREIRLSGEAYFDVTSNPKRPFIIHTDKITVRVTGTSFNVRDYPNEAKAETSLITGKVEVRALNNPGKVYFLKPNEKIVLRGIAPMITKPFQNRIITENRTKPIDVQIEKLHFDPIDNIPVETAWLNDQLAFNDESFRDVADKMEKWYNVSIEIRSAKLAQTHLNGKFEKETLLVALEALKYSTPFNYSIEGNKIIIDKN